MTIKYIGCIVFTLILFLTACNPPEPITQTPSIKDNTQLHPGGLLKKFQAIDREALKAELETGKIPAELTELRAKLSHSELERSPAYKQLLDTEPKHQDLTSIRKNIASLEKKLKFTKNDIVE